MKVLFICKGEYRYFFPRIGHALRELDGCSAAAVAFTGPAARMIERTNAFEDVRDLSEHLKECILKFSLCESIAELLRFEAVEGRDTLNTMVQADRILRNYPHERIIRILAAIVAFWNQTFAELKPDAILGEVACAAEWIAWSLARSLDIPYLIPYPTPVANRFFFIGEPRGNWLPLESRYEKNKRRRLSFEEEQAAESFVQEFRVRKSRPPFLAWGDRSPFVPDITQLFRRAARIPFRIQSYMETGQYEVGSYHGTPPWQPIWEDASRIARHAICESLLFEHSVVGKPYIYFPLHVQPEFTTDVRAPFLSNQIAVIENISKSVPVSHLVLVKEHPGMKGERKLGFYRQLKSLHNVRLISPSGDSHELIEKSDVVITITGSTAWEAILYEKPVIALGPVCYGFYDLLYRCNRLSELPDLVRAALDCFQPDHDLLLRFVWSFLETAYELAWGDPIRMPTVLEMSNVRSIALAISSEISTRIQDRSVELALS